MENMENKNKIEESLNRFNELISESNLYGNLVNEELLNEGGGLLTIVDDILAKLKTKGIVLGGTELSTEISTASKRVSKNLDILVDNKKFEKYITNKLSNDIEEILMSPIDGDKFATTFLDDAGSYSRNYYEYLDVVEDFVIEIDRLIPSLSNGSVTVNKLKKSENIKKLLSLLDDTEGADSFLKKYDEYMSPDWAKKLPKGLKSLVDTSRYVGNIGKRIVLTASNLGIINKWENLFKWTLKSSGGVIDTSKRFAGDLLILPLRLFTLKYWVTYVSVAFAKAALWGEFCEGKATGDYEGLDESYSNPKDIIDEDIKVYLNEGKEEGWGYYLPGFLNALRWFVVDVYFQKYLKHLIGDPLSLINAGLWGKDNWQCGDAVTNLYKSIIDASDDPGFKTRVITFKDGTTKTGQEILDDIQKEVDKLIGGDYEQSNLIEKVKEYKEKVIEYKNRKGLN